MALSKEAGLALLRELIQQSCEVKQSFSPDLLQAVWALAEKTAAAFGNGKKVLLMGNGGSAADAQHIAAELVGRFRLARKGLPALALTTNTSVLTALSNDLSFEECFARQLEALATPEDIVVAISTSGRSPNVIRGIETAGLLTCTTAAFTGRSGGRLAGLVHLLLAVPSDDTQRIQEAHSLLGHMYCELVERILFE